MQKFLLKVTAISGRFAGKYITGFSTIPDVREKAQLHTTEDLSGYAISLQRGYLVAIPTVPFETSVNLEVPYEPIHD